MATVNATPIQGSSTSVQVAAKPRRVLACVLCQSRKVKCDRKFPCENCVKARVNCVPATLTPRRRRRRLPERELLDRLKHYERLLRDNNIKFEPGDVPVAQERSPSEDGGGVDSSGEVGSEGPGEGPGGSSSKASTKSKTVNIWNAMNQQEQPQSLQDDDNEDSEDGASDDDSFGTRPSHIGEAWLRKAWGQSFESNDELLFGSPKTNTDLSTLHPKLAHIIKLWQIYLDNVSPLLKVTHDSTLQAIVIDAASDLTHINPSLEVLMFSIYCVSILSLTDVECRQSFGSPRVALLRGYQFGCQQALQNCGFLRSNDRDCLTAFYLYLVSTVNDTDPRSLSATLGLAVRIGLRMGIHIEKINTKCTVLEAELRRRLWWSLIIFDNRICELSHYKTPTLADVWDCKIPSNVNDFEMGQEMKTQTVKSEKPTEAIFAVVRSKLAQSVRTSAFYTQLDGTNPTLKRSSKHWQPGPLVEDSEVSALEKEMDAKYLDHCSPENPLQFMTLWTARGYFARSRLFEHYSKYSRPNVQQTDIQRDAAMSYALRLLECDTKLMTSPSTQGYLWLLQYQFPAPAYFHILQDLKRRPVRASTESAWEIMSDNSRARSASSMERKSTPMFQIFSRIVLQAWEACDTAFRQAGTAVVNTPWIVEAARPNMMPGTSSGQNDQHPETSINPAAGMNTNNNPTPPTLLPTAGNNYQTQLPHEVVGRHEFTTTSSSSEPSALPEHFTPYIMDFDMNQTDWTIFDWNSMSAPSW